METEKQKQEAIKLCICPDCPSWVECREKGAYCLEAVGRSNCITKEEGCLCPACPLVEKLNLKYTYFCTRGSEKEQAGG
ncbi:MAG: DUF2769 domain-containing protein [Candidatus Altiarchaeota archaeon]|nr:DUF2769 domain-containing protein [Candidatus Altiarchaeota archaeon]